MKIQKKTWKFFITFMSLFFFCTSLLMIPSSVQAATSQSRVITLAAGSKYATKLYINDSGVPGPVVLIVGGVHGNETAGYKAARQLVDFMPAKGKLLVLPEANKLAVEAHTRVVSGQTDLNRAFPTTKYGTATGTLAQAILQMIKDYDVDWVMDMHEGIDYYKNPSSSSVGQSLIYWPDSSTKTVGTKIVNLLNSKISSSYKKFTLLRYPAKGSLTRAAAVTVGANTFIFETCSKENLSSRVSKQLTAANRLFRYLGMD